MIIPGDESRCGDIENIGGIAVKFPANDGFSVVEVQNGNPDFPGLPTVPTESVRAGHVQPMVHRQASAVEVVDLSVVIKRAVWLSRIPKPARRGRPIAPLLEIR